MRQLENRSFIEDKEIVDLIEQNNILDTNTFLVLNGGTGLGKTKQTMLNLKIALARKSGRAPCIAVVESRTSTVDQINVGYIQQIESIGGITVIQRISFMNMIKKEEANKYDWIIIDECHGLFSEASFAEDAEFIATWIKTARKPNQHIIFVTANDEYFDSIARRFFPEEYNFIYLFADHTKYYSPTYVKKIYTIITNLMKSRIMSLLPQFRGKKGIFFFPRASQVLKWYEDLEDAGFSVGLMVSQANQTPATLTTIKDQQLKDALIDNSNGNSGYTIADICNIIERERIKKGLKSTRQSIIQDCLIPEDIEILIATDTLQEGVSILSQVDYIVIEGYTEVEVRQKLGRYRGNLDELYLLFNPSRVQREINEMRETFNLLFSLVSKNDQPQLGELYGRQEMAKYVNKYLIKYEKDGKVYYRINQAMYENFLETSRKYEALPSQQYAQCLLSPYVRAPAKDIIYLDPKDFKVMDLKERLYELAEKWSNIPLKGKAQQLLIEDFDKYEIRNGSKKITTFRSCLNMFKKINIFPQDGYSNQLLANEYPDYVGPRDKFKYISV